MSPPRNRYNGSPGCSPNRVSNSEFHPDAAMLRDMTYRELRDYALDNRVGLDEVDGAQDRAELIFAIFHGFSTVDHQTGERYDGGVQDTRTRRSGRSPGRSRGGWQNLSAGPR
jgi:hypothetical protein